MKKKFNLFIYKVGEKAKKVFVWTGVILGILLVIFALSLLVNFIPAAILYFILVKILGVTTLFGIGLGFWNVYWITFLVVFVANLIFNNNRTHTK